jgi:hypothetical protein
LATQLVGKSEGWLESGALLRQRRWEGRFISGWACGNALAPTLKRLVVEKMAGLCAGLGLGD